MKSDNAYPCIIKNGHQGSLLGGLFYFLHLNTTCVSLWMEVPAAQDAGGQAKLGCYDATGVSPW